MSLDENVQPWWSNYFKKAVELSLISAQDTVTFVQPIARYEVALFLYRLKVRWTMYNNLNTSILIDEIIKTLEDTSMGTKKSAKISVDVLSLNNIAFTDGYAEIFGERYKVKKSVLNSYNVGTNSFVWYGDLMSLETDLIQGSLTVIMTNGVLSEGTVRLFNSKNYYISKDMVTTSYYWLKEV